MRNETGDESFLDNPVWHALRGRLSRFVAADSRPDWIRFDPELGLFSGVERIDEAGWNRVADWAGLDGVCGLFRDAVPPAPRGWDEQFRGSCLQMIAGDVMTSPGQAIEAEIEVLGPDDAQEMLALATQTEPGPYFLRTRELGRFVGIRRDGRLIAMAGERFRVPGFVEISAVCTHPDARGQGLAAGLTLDVALSIRAGGDRAFLQVLDSNEPAIRLYEKLGFSVRRKLDVVFAQWRGSDWIPGD